MRNKVIIAISFSINGMIQVMDARASHGPLNPNNALVLATISGPLNKQDLLDIDFLFQVGADPNFQSPLCGITHLMRAVRVNELGLVKLLLSKGADSNIRHHKSNTFVRGFNVIYNKRRMLFLVRPITEAMLQIETHNYLCPDESIECPKILYNMSESSKLRDALLIDKILEDDQAFSGVIDSKHPLLCLLRKPCVKRALAYVLNDNFEDIPSNIRVCYVFRNEKRIY